MCERNNRGMTLITLLVMIAAVGVASAVALSTLSNSRIKSADINIKANLEELSGQSLLYAQAHTGNYEGFCTSTVVLLQISSAKQVARVDMATRGDSEGGEIGYATCHDQIGGWAAEVPLRSGHNIFWCVDSTGLSTTTTGSGLITPEDISCY